jgi:predicted Zn finger-like uncharacterized protein
MRLTCPNCGTEYEVPEDLIPEDGKHVQCTGCHTRWFVRGGDTTLLSEEQIIHRLETWSPRPVAVPTPPALDFGTVVEAEAEAGAEVASDLANEPQALPDPEPIVAAPSKPDALLEPDTDPGPGVMPEPDTVPGPAAGPAPKTASPRPLTAEPEVTTDDLPETFIWENHDSAGTTAPSWREPAGSAQDVPRPGQQARPRASQRLELPRATVAPVFDDPPPTRSRFWRGLSVALLLAGLTVAAYLWTDTVIARWPVFEPALGVLAAWIDVGREWAETWLTPLRSH